MDYQTDNEMGNELENERVTWIKYSRHDELEPDACEEDYLKQFLPMEIDENGIVFRNLIDEIGFNREENSQKLEEVVSTEEPEPIVWEKDDYEDLYGSETSTLDEENHNIEMLERKQIKDQAAKRIQNVMPKGDVAQGVVAAPKNPNLSYVIGPKIEVVYEEGFRIKPGDVLLFTSPRYERTVGNQAGQMRSFINVHHDPHYFTDCGQYR